MKGSLSKFIKKTSKLQRIAIISVIMVMIGAIASVSYIATKAASNDNGLVFTTDDGLWSYVWDRENKYKITIVSYNGTDTNIVFPSKTYTHYDNGQYYNDTKVNFTAVDQHSDGRSFFTNMESSKVESVTIPDNITEIGDYVFSGCSSMTSVSLPSTLTSIGDSAFRDCTSLSSISLPSTLTSIGDWSFYNCTSLSQVNLPNSLKSMDYGAFENCTSLTSINLPSGMTAIPNSAFRNTGLKSISIPYGYTMIGNNSFSYCRDLVNVVIPQSVKTIDSVAFGYCESLEKVILPDSVTQLNGFTFDGCTSLKTVTLPKGIKEIPNSMFSSCTNLTEVKNIDSITKIGDNAFSGCSSLTSLNLPDTLTELGGYTFSNAGLDGSQLNLKNIEVVGAGSFSNMKFSQPFTIPSGISSLTYNLFSESTIPKIIIPNTVESVSGGAFRSNANIEELVWNSYYSIPYNLFENNPYIKRVTINADISSICSYSFRNCSALEEVQARGLNYVYDYAFANSTKLKTFNASNVREIQRFAFYQCSSLTNISDFIATVSKIGEQAFRYCDNLGKVTLGSQLEYLEASAFSDSGITELDASNTTNCYLKDHVFFNCTKLTKVYWNNPLKAITNYAVERYNYRCKYTFGNCYSLKEFTFGPLCTNLCNGGANFFYGCINLEDVYILCKTYNYVNINPDLMWYIYFYNAQAKEVTTTVHYYDVQRIGDLVKSFVKNQSSQSKVVAVPITDDTSTKTVSSIAMDPVVDKTVEVGGTKQFTATITYDNGETVKADSSNSYWKVSNTSYATIDNNGKLKGLAKGNGIGVYVYSKETANKSYNININIVESTGSVEQVPATSLELESFYVDDNDILNREYEDKPFGIDEKSNGAYVYMRYNIKPMRTTDQPVIKVTQGEDILSFNYTSINQYGNQAHGTSYFNHLRDDEGNYKYGDVTIEVTVGDCSKTFTFTLENADGLPNGKFPTGAYIDGNTRWNTNLVVGNSYQYTAFPTEWYSVDPYMWYEVKYEISDPDIADLKVEIVENGAYDPNKSYKARVATVTPKKSGQVTLRAYPARIKGYYDEIIINITDPNESEPVEPTLPTERPDESGDPDVIWATSVSFTNNVVTLVAGNKFTMNPLIQPANNTDELNFYSYDKAIASVDANTGVVTANAVGEVTVGVTTSSGLNSEMKIIVVDKEVKTTSVTIPGTFTIKEGKTAALSFSRTPENSTDNVIWSSDNENAVKVSGGNITAVAQGTATITVTSGDITKTCVVTVTKAATDITLNTDSAEMKHGETLKLNATLYPIGVDDDITWTSSNTAIATVSQTGEVKAVGYGNVQITAKVNEYSATCSIFVSPNIDFKILGASIRVSDPYGVRFGIRLGKTGDFNDVKIVEYGTVMMPTEKLNGTELSLTTDNVLRIQGRVVYSEDSSSRVYTGVLINIPTSYFNTNVSGRGYLIYEDTNGVQHTIYTDVVSRSFYGVAQSAYDSYSKITNPSSVQLDTLNRLKKILGK